VVVVVVVSRLAADLGRVGNQFPVEGTRAGDQIGALAAFGSRVVGKQRAAEVRSAANFERQSSLLSRIVANNIEKDVRGSQAARQNDTGAAADVKIVSDVDNKGRTVYAVQRERGSFVRESRFIATRSICLDTIRRSELDWETSTRFSRCTGIIPSRQTT
jgi:uncharacterized protein YecE (DUF72 family)